MHDRYEWITYLLLTKVKMYMYKSSKYIEKCEIACSENIYMNIFIVELL